ncbi:MAG: hypothetical protein ABFR65_03380 [Pseudomonadota bacterium]
MAKRESKAGIRALRLLTLVLTVSYPITLHLTIIQGHTHAAVWILLVISLAHSLLVFSSGRHALAEMLVPAVAMLAVISLFLNDATILFLPPILIASSLLFLFGRTLLPGEEALISQLARRLEGEGDEAVLRYTRKLTWIWCLFFAAMLIESVVLALFAPIEIWSLFTNLINYLLMVGLFLVELLYRAVRFRRLPSPGVIKQLFKRGELQQWGKD